MESVKILHTADLHLGFEYLGNEDISSKRYNDNLDTFSYLINVCNIKKVDFLLIAGDLFDSDTPDRRVVNRVISDIKKLNETSVIISPGNHDCYNENGVYGHTSMWPDNVYIFTGDMDYFEFYVRATTVRIYGAAFTNRYQETSLMVQRRVMKDMSINIGVFHGDLVSDNGSSIYNPITVSQINKNMFDYTALGHIHKRMPIQKCDYGLYSYCGTPEGHGFNETGILGAYIGTVYCGGADLSFIRTAKRIYSKIYINYEDEIKDAHDCSQRIIYEMKQRYLGDYKDFIYKIYLRGINSNNIQTEDILKNLKGVFYVTFIDESIDNFTDNKEEEDEYNLLLENFKKNILLKIQDEKMKVNASDIMVERYEMALKLGSESILKHLK